MEVGRYVVRMEVHFTPQQESQLVEIAARAGTNPQQLVTDVVVRYLEGEREFISAVERGIAAADRGDFIEEEEMDSRIERMFEH